jgi:hypothetical protein
MNCKKRGADKRFGLASMENCFTLTLSLQNRDRQGWGNLLREVGRQMAILNNYSLLL